MRWVGSTSRPEIICLRCRRAAHGLGPDDLVNEARTSGRLRVRRPPGVCRRCDMPIDPESRRNRYCSGECARKARYARGSGSAPKGSTSDRGYDSEHQKLRAALLPSAYETPCPLCGEVMEEGQRLHLDHTEDRASYRGITHARCNVLDGARRGGQAFRAKKLEANLPRPKAPVGAPKPQQADSDRRKRLEDVREELETRMPSANNRDYAALVSRYQSVLAELAALPVVKDSNGIDDLAKRRQRRRSAATGS